jgi:hypothetical protein
VRELNGRIQDRATPPHIAETCYLRIVDAVAGFVDSDVFHYLRSDTRRDFAQFRDTFGSGDVTRNKLVCEGFDKYLDSLAFVSQRGVLIKHDTDLKTKISADLDRALKFAAILPDVVCEVIEQAFIKGERLTGLNDQIDELVLQWSLLTADDRADPGQAIDYGRQLFELVRPPPAPTSSGDGDFF